MQQASLAFDVGIDFPKGLGLRKVEYLAEGDYYDRRVCIDRQSDWSCAAPLAILMLGQNRGNFYKQMLWLMAIITLYAVAFFVFNNHIYGMVHMACWFTNIDSVEAAPL